jgi:hypothetical protein
MKAGNKKDGKYTHYDQKEQKPTRILITVEPSR